VGGLEESSFVFSQRASQITNASNFTETVSLQVAQICMATQTGEVEISWPDTITAKTAELTKECFKKGKSKKVFRVHPIIHYLVMKLI
jgi:hypothetical protein